MERNSRDFQRRIEAIDRNAETICDFMRSRSVAGGYSPKDDRSGVAIKEVYYSKYMTRENYDRCRPSPTSSHGFGVFSRSRLPPYSPRRPFSMHYPATKALLSVPISRWLVRTRS